MDAADRRMSRIRSDMIWEQPFWGFHALSMKLVRDDVGDITTTMATDGTHHYWHPQFLAEHNDPEITGVDVHELLHKLNMHHLRMGNRDPMLWNMSCDYAINPLILKAGFTLPKDRLEDARFDGMDAEQIYDILRSEATVVIVNVPWGQVMQPTREDGTPLSKAEMDAAEMEIKLNIVEGAKTAEKTGYGSSAGMIKRLVAKAKEESVDWREVIRAFVSRNGPTTNTTWRRPGRRGLASGVIMPSPVRSSTPEIAVLVDTSGSIDKKALAQFAAEIDAINREVMPERIVFAYGGTQLIETMVLEQFDEAPADLKGGGGTDLQRMVTELADEAPDAKMMVILTDLICTGMDQDPGIPVLWVCWGNKWQQFVSQTTYGEIVPMGRGLQ